MLVHVFFLQYTQYWVSGSKPSAAPQNRDTVLLLGHFIQSTIRCPHSVTTCTISCFVTGVIVITMDIHKSEWCMLIRWRNIWDDSYTSEGSCRNWRLFARFLIICITPIFGSDDGNRNEQVSLWINVFIREKIRR